MEGFVLSLPIVQMIMKADVATIVIIAILAVMSFGSWGIIIVKLFSYRKNQRANASFFQV